MLKGVGSGSLEASIRGIRNAAWDLVYLSYWARKATANDPRVGWVFCSRDGALMEIARSLASPLDEGATAKARLALHERNWPREDADALLGFYRELLSTIQADPGARDSQIRGRPTAATVLEDLESQLAVMLSKRSERG